MGVPEIKNGFKFQYHTVLVLFVDNPKHFCAIGAEKGGEDCVLKTIDGKYWYAQCKFSSNRDTPNKNLMNKGLIELKKHNQENVEKLLLVTNIYYPFCTKSLFASNVFLHIKSYNELHLSEKKKLLEYLKSLKGKKKKDKYSKEDITKSFFYAYCNYEMQPSIETNSLYLDGKIKEFVDGLPNFPKVSTKRIANDWLRIVENKADTIKIGNDEDLIDKGCLAGAFCNSTLFDRSFSDISQKYRLNANMFEDELNLFCINSRESFIQESIDISYAIWSDYYVYRTNNSLDNNNALFNYVNSLELDKNVPGFILDNFLDKGNDKGFYQLLIYKYFVACIIENANLVLRVREEFGCDY